MATILIIDDVIECIEMTRSYLEADGHNVHIASSGLIGLQQLVQQQPDLVLLDVDMPIIGGLETIRVMKKISLVQHIPVIMLSGQDADSNVIEALDLGAHDFVVKGSKYPVLVARIRSALGLKEAQDRLSNINQALERATQAKSDFLSKMSHEIRTPLTGVIGISQLLSESLRDPTDVNYSHIITSCANTLLSLVNDILDFSKIEAGKMELESTPFDLEKIATEAINIFKIKAAEKNLDLVLDVSPDLKKSYIGDPTRIRQIMINFLGNAIKFTDQGSVVLSLQINANGCSAKDEVIITVRDTGIGIAENVIKDLFQPFKQATADTTRKYGGTGLGLSICYHLIELMGGTAKIESKLGTGSKFCISIPLDSAPAVSPLPVPAEASPHLLSSPATLNILIAEDNSVNQLVISKILENMGHVCATVKDGYEALETYKTALQNKTDFDIILMDYEMPRLNGLDSTKAIREWEQLHSLISTPIYALSAHVMKEQIDQCSLAGMDGYIAKPINQEKLMGLLATIRKKL